jgi:hypothetical protein
MGPAADEVGNVLLLLVAAFDDVGTCWNARVTSWSDILDGTFAADVGGGVSPSSDLTSCNVNGRAVRSSAMPSREFTACTRALSEGCDQTAFRCSGSGALAGDSLADEKLKGDFVQGVLYDADPGVMRFLSTYIPVSYERCLKYNRTPTDSSKLLESSCVETISLGELVSFPRPFTTRLIVAVSIVWKFLSGESTAEENRALGGSLCGDVGISSSSLKTVKDTECFFNS